MVYFATSALALLAAISGASAATCVQNTLYCGWTLETPPTPYAERTLTDAAAAQGVILTGANNGTVASDSLFLCLANNAVKWDSYCGRGGCNAASAENHTPALCRNGPQSVPPQKRFVA
ncbi:hypothetical protein GQ53DRAFT_829885 [Thozetella sp. PMI_491]|nr:hypothetical protein GQ53DRAFT_829885 [Thozetella sp. PMI_491]